MANREEQQPIDSASSDDENGDGENNPSEPVCPICLGKVKEKAFVNACLHQFCFGCLWDWIKVKLECPLCKQKIVSVFHNIRADDDYSEIRIERTQGRAILNPERNYPRNAEIRLQDQHEVQHGPVLLAVPGNEGRPMPGSEGRPMPGSEGRPMPGSERRPMPGSEGRPMPGSEGRPMPGSEGRPMPGSERRPMPGSEGRPMPGSEGRPMPGSEGRPMPGSEGRPMPGSEGRPMPGSEGRPMPGSEGRPMPGSEGRPMPGSEGRPMPGSEGRPMPGSEGRPMPGSEGRPMPGREWRPMPGNEGQLVQEDMEQLVQEDRGQLDQEDGGQLDEDSEGESLPDDDDDDDDDDEEEEQEQEQEVEQQELPPQGEERAGSQPQARADILSFQVRLRSTSQHLEILPHSCQHRACRAEHVPVQNQQSPQSNVQMHHERHPQCTCHSHHATHQVQHTHHSVHRTHDPTQTHHSTHQAHRTHHPTSHARHTHHPTHHARHIHHSFFHAQHTGIQSSHTQGVPTETQPLPRPRGQQTFTSLLNLSPPTLTTHSHQYEQPQVPLQSQTRPHRSQHAQNFSPVNRLPDPPPSSHALFNQQQSRQTLHTNDQRTQAHLQTQSLPPQRSDSAAQTSPPPLIRLSETVQSQFQSPPPLLRLPESMSPPSHPPPLLRMDESHSPTLHSELPPPQHNQSSPPPLIPLLDAIQAPSSWPPQSQYTQQPPTQIQAQHRYTLPTQNLSMAHTSHSESQRGIHEPEPLNLTRPSRDTILQYAIQTALNSVSIPRESHHQMYSQGIGSSRVPDTDDCIVVKHVKTRRRKIRGILSFDADTEWAQADEGRFQSMNSNSYLSTPSTSRSVPNYNQAPPPREYHWRGPLKRRGEYDSSDSDSD